MPAPFAARESRLNSAVERHLTNAEVVFNAGAPFGAVFGREAANPFGGESVDAAEHTLGFIASRAPALAEGDEVLVNGVVYRVTGDVQPDESGWLTVNVYPAT